MNWEEAKNAAYTGSIVKRADSGTTVRYNGLTLIAYDNLGMPQGSFSPSQDDIEAEDWEVVQPE